jgi:peptide/nickel transport system substrate-binding protein
MRRVIAALSLLVLAVACTSGAKTIPGVLRMGEQEEPDSLNLMFGNNSASDEVSSLMYSFLIRYDDNGNLIPDLATAVPTRTNGGVTADGKTITVHLRKNARWSDGEPVTSADWMFTYHAVNNPRNNVKSKYGWDQIASANAPDPYTIVVHFKQPSVAAYDILTMGGTAYPPLPAHLLAKLPDINTASINSAPIASGPFVLKSWNHGSSLVFEPNPYYWRGAAKLKQIIWKILPDTNTQYAQLQTHEIDLYRNVDSNSVYRLKTVRGISVQHRLIANWRHLGINVSRPILSDVRVRQAIAAGVDWKRINDTVYHGINQLAVSDVFPQVWAAPKLLPYTYDPALAKSLLSQAGWHPGADGMMRRGGQPLRLTISANSAAKTNEQSELLIQSMLRALGIDLTIRNYPATLMFARNGPLYTGKYDLEWSVDTNGPDPDNGGSWNSAFIPPHGANTSWLRDPVVDETTSAAARTYDQAERKKLYQREEERLREIVPAIFFYWEVSYYGINSDMKGFRPAAFLADTWNSWEWQI